jgi:transcriptional regulator with XRE-family HTH domain
MSTENVDNISPDQCRGARAVLDMTQPQLASAAGLGLSTVVDFERSRRPVSTEAIQAMRKALERAGIEFIDENGGGPGVRVRKHQRAKKPK